MFRKHLPLITLLLIFIVILLTNFSVSNFLIGWDNLLPELNFSLNIKRSIFSVWQEYQGLGLLAGNGHAAELPRQIILLLFSYVLPLNWIRQAYTFSMLLIGALGVYSLIKKLLFSDRNDFSAQTIFLLGGLYYLLNLATMQIFYVPFEPFITHFAFLPWLILSAVIFIKNPVGKNIVFFIIINVLALPQAQVPTLFIVYFFVLLIVTSILNIEAKKRQFLKNSLKLLALTLIINSIWLFPFIYFVFTNSGVAVGAKINQMATETVFLQNKEFGTISDVMLLKGFWFNNVDPNIQGNFAYMLSTWRNYISTPLITTVGYLFFGIITLGFLSALKTKKAVYIAFCTLFVLSFTMLATDTAPFSWIDSLFRQIPLFSQVFRFPFTKFANIALLTYAVFFAVGFEKIRSSSFLKMEKLRSYFLPIILVALLIIFVFPMFKGNLFYEKEKINIPSEYNEVFDFFKSQNPNTRIANFPQYTFWGWNFYNWGYGGSGFLWYGIQQPILDRAFDVWSRSNENYYWELSNALYSENLQDFESVLNKYQISWLIIDKNVFNPSSAKALFVPELKSLINQIPSIQKAKSFGNIEVYKVNLKDNPKNFVFTATSLNSANTYQWGNLDQAYIDLGNYISSRNPDYSYPFRSLFSNKNKNDEEFNVKNEASFLTLSNDLIADGEITLNIPKFDKAENIIPASIVSERRKDNTLALSILIQTPEISIIKGSNSRVIYSQNIKEPLVILPQDYPNQININVNGVENFPVSYAQGSKNIGSGFLSLKQDNLIVMSDPKSGYLQTKTIKPIDIASHFGNDNRVITLNIEKNSIIKVRVPKINDSYESFEKSSSRDLISQIKNCDNFNKGPFSSSLKGRLLELKSQNASPCISFYMPTLSHNQGYVLFINSINIQGRSLHTWLLNENEKFSLIDTYLGKEATSTFIIPPQENFGRAYSLHFDNISITNEKTINDLGNISLYPIPYNFLTSIRINNSKTMVVNNQLLKQNIYVNHPNEAYYEVKGITGVKTLILSQSYNEGWHAYASKGENIFNKLFPFLGAAELKNHVLVNNWENGWILEHPAVSSQPSVVIIVFLPQYLEYIGFLLSIGILSYIVFRYILRSKNY